MLKHTLKVMIPLTVIFITGCATKGISPVPKSFIADLDVVRSLTPEELADNQKIKNEYNRKQVILKKMASEDIAEEKKLVVNYSSGNCLFSQFQIASRINNSDSYKNFLASCNNKSNYYHKLAAQRLSALRKLKAEEQKPDPKKKVVLQKFPEPTRDSPSVWSVETSIKKPTVVEPKIAKKQAVNIPPNKPQTIIIPTGSIGEIKISRIKILDKTLESKLDDYFDIVPKELFEEAKDKAFEELDYDECTEDQCIMKIQELLQVENAFKMELILDDGDTQISLTWTNLKRKTVEEEYCEGCKTKDLRKMIGGLVEKLVNGNN